MRIERTIGLPYFEAGSRLSRRVKKTVEDYTVHEDASARNQGHKRQDQENEEEQEASHAEESSLHIIA